MAKRRVRVYVRPMRPLLLCLGLLLTLFGILGLIGTVARWSSDPLSFQSALISTIFLLGGLLLAVRMARLSIEAAVTSALPHGGHDVSIPPRPDTNAF